MSWLRKLPMYMQSEEAECGLACIAMIANFHGHNIDLHSLRSIIATAGRGMNLLEMRHLFLELQLKAQALRVELEELIILPKPAVLHWNHDHFVVLQKITKKWLWIHDPAVGIRKCKREEVSKAFTGITLIVEPMQQFVGLTCRQRLKLRDFIFQIAGYKHTIILLTTASICIEIGYLIPTILLQYITDAAVETDDILNFIILLIGVTLSLSLFVLLTYVKERFLMQVVLKFKEQFFANVMYHLMFLPLTFFQKRLNGQIQFSFQALGEIQKKITTDAFQFLFEVVILLVSAIVMMIYSVQLSMVVFFAIITSFIIRVLSYHHLKSFRQQAFHQHGLVAAFFLETIQLMLPIKAAAKELERLERWRVHYVNALNSDFVVSRLQLVYQTFNQLLANIEYVFIVGIGVYLIKNNKISIGMLLAFLAYRTSCVTKAQDVLTKFFEYLLLKIEISRVNDILSMPTEKLNLSFKLPKKVTGELTVQDVSFSYSPEHSLIEQVNLTVNAGEKLAIIGPSGCGKTTLLKLMMGLMAPLKGEILLDGTKITTWGLHYYRQLIGAVMQEDKLLSASLSENIIFFSERVDHNWLYEVCRICAVEEFVNSLPMGYATRIGEQGILLSGGQKARILLARALYKKPKILFLDEATSHLDVVCEANIYAAISGLNLTQIMVAHRSESIDVADRVYALHKPR